MNTNIKISLTINLEGIPTKSREKVKIPYRVRKKHLFSFKKGDKDGDIIVKEGFRKHFPLVPTEASQHIDICEEAYNYFIGDEVPSWEKPNRWVKLPKRQRLETHLRRIAESLGGKSYSYEILS